MLGDRWYWRGGAWGEGKERARWEESQNLLGQTWINLGRVKDAEKGSASVMCSRWTLAILTQAAQYHYHPQEPEPCILESGWKAGR